MFTLSGTLFWKIVMITYVFDVASFLPPTLLGTLVAHSLTVLSSTLTGTPTMEYYGLAAMRTPAVILSRSLILDRLAISVSFLARIMRRALRAIILTSFLPRTPLSCFWTRAGSIVDKLQNVNMSDNQTTRFEAQAKSVLIASLFYLFD